ncbi:MAG: precorrin-3B C(17)-methyltransferase [Candidatus Puniceispirillaceae bacterium]
MDLTAEPLAQPVFVTLNETGFQLASSLAVTLGGEVHGLASRLPHAPVTFEAVSQHLAELFVASRPIVALCAAGIVVRSLGSVLGDKWHDSPVVCMSEDGKFIVPVLGGHHGAIALARRIAAITDGQAAITTASDIGTGISLDEPPAGYVLANPENAKNVMAAIVNGKGADVSQTGALSYWFEGVRQGVDVKLSLADKVVQPQDNELVYYKQDLVLGVGCARGCAPEELADLLLKTLEAYDLHPAMIAAIGSVDLKADEPAILQLADKLAVPFRVFEPQALAALADRVSYPSAIVEEEVGTPSVSEAAALALAGGEASLLVTKHKSANATVAIARRNGNKADRLAGRKPGKLSLIGIGPGKGEWRTPEASRLIAEADLLVGYRLYIDLLGGSAARKPAMHFALGEEELRCRTALEEAAKGQDVALICSGDAGIYAMGALVFELLARDEKEGGVSDSAKRVDVITAPGISALQAAAARSGAVLGHDFCTISLSDLLTPWEVIEQRLHGAGAGDFVIAFYNPVSMRRKTQLARAKEILLSYRGADVPVLLASNLGRVQEKLTYRTLGELDVNEVDMLTVVMVGSSQSKMVHLGRAPAIYTPRGYAKHLDKE